MLEFYAIYSNEGQRYLAVIAAPERPVNLQYVSRNELISTMDALGHDWQLRSEIELPEEYVSEISTAWLEKAAEAKTFHHELPPPVSLFHWGQYPSA